MISAEKEKKTELETYFDKFRKNIVGVDQSFETPYGMKKMIYTLEYLKWEWKISKII